MLPPEADGDPLYRSLTALAFSSSFASHSTTSRPTCARRARSVMSASASAGRSDRIRAELPPRRRDQFVDRGCRGLELAGHGLPRTPERTRPTISRRHSAEA